MPTTHNHHDKKLHRFSTIFPFTKHAWFRFACFIIARFEVDRCREKAASLTYTTMLSIVPIFTVLLVILSSVPALQTAKGQIQQLIYQNLLPSSGLQVSNYIDDFADKSSNLTFVGIIILFITTIMMLSKIEDAFNRIWHVPNSGTDIIGVMRYWTLISLGPIVLGTAFILSSTVASLSLLNQQVAGYAIDWEVWVKVLSFLMTLSGFTAIYWFVPNTRVPFKHAAYAGIAIGVLFELLKTAFGSIMANFTSYELVYGAFAALPVLLLWIYLSWCLILAGVEISRGFSLFDTEQRGSRHPIVILLTVIGVLYKNQRMGKATSETELHHALSPREMVDWHEYEIHLRDQNIIAQTSEGAYLLKCNLGQLTLGQLCRNLPYALPNKEEVSELSQKSIQNVFVDTEKTVYRKLNMTLADLLE